MSLTVAVIGGGIFGSAIALELSKFYETTLFESQQNILCGASTSNHCRHHAGFHYPRSKDTVTSIRHASASFEKVFGDCLVADFPSYYAVSKTQTKTTSAQFLEFCKSSKLQFEICQIPNRIFDPSKLEICIKTSESVYDTDLLRDLILLAAGSQPALQMVFNHKVVGISIINAKKRLSIKNHDDLFEVDYDFVINCTYTDFNEFCDWINAPKVAFSIHQFNQHSGQTFRKRS